MFRRGIFERKTDRIIDRIEGSALRYEDCIRQIRLLGKTTFAVCLIAAYDATHNCAHRRLIIN